MIRSSFLCAQLVMVGAGRMLRSADRRPMASSARTREGRRQPLSPLCTMATGLRQHQTISDKSLKGYGRNMASPAPTLFCRVAQQSPKRNAFGAISPNASNK